MKKEKEEEKIWSRVCKLALEYKKYIPVIILCLLCSSIMTFLQPLIIRKITDQGMMEKNMKCIIVYSSIMLFTTMISQIIEVIQARLFSDVHNGLTLSLYKKVYKKLENLPMGYYDEKGSAEIVNTVSADISNVAAVFDKITTFSISSILQIVGGVVGLALLDWKLSLILVLIIPIKYWVSYIFSKKKTFAFGCMIENNRKFFAWLGDCISGIQEMKLWGLFGIKFNDFKNLQKGMMDSYKENILLDQYCTFWVSVLDVILNALLYIIGGGLIVRGTFTIGIAFAFITYSSYVVSPITFLINVKYYFAQIKPSAKRLFVFLDSPEEYKDFEKTTILKEVTEDMKRNRPVLEFMHVGFGYVKKAKVLKDISLTVYKGDKIGIIGENGSGKSTIIKLILGFYQAEKGMIKLNGVQLKDMGIKELRERISVVSQNPYLFRGTIEENINIDGMASHEEVVEACIKSGAASFINKFDEGYHQIIGRDGAKLSGGEKQKLAVARAFVKRADILLMDEATSGFDIKSDRALNKILCNNFENQTVIFITHRHEELEGADRVYKLSEGMLIRYM